MTIAGTIEALFKQFIAARELRQTLDLFAELCQRLNISTIDDHTVIYRTLREHLGNESALLWKSLDKRKSNEEYGNGEICSGMKALIVGSGPCGLRLAIEFAMLGVKTVVVESREYFSRNNVLHLWPFVIHDIKMLGGKAIVPRFCTGGLDHISIKRMQQMLMKIALILGVEIHCPAKYGGFQEPDPATGRGWRVRMEPADCPAARLDYDILIGATGKTGGHAFPDFTHKTMRGKLAIAITANFQNNNTSADVRVREIGGLFFIFDQEFFNNLKQQCGVELENFVYYKDDTHYFVMTVKKKSLLQKGVLKKDYKDPATLLSYENRDKEKLLEFSREVALATTQHQLPNMEFALNHHNEEDVAMFDFTSMSQANHSCYVRRRHGRTLMQGIVGDLLLEPFWPTGSGCARGFLGVMDTAWLVRSWHLKELPELAILSDKEGAFQILSQTKPDNMAKALGKYTIDPLTRYGMRLRTKTLIHADKVKHLINTDEVTPLATGFGMRPPSADVTPAKNAATPKPRDNPAPVYNPYFDKKTPMPTRTPVGMKTPLLDTKTPMPVKLTFDQLSVESRSKKRMRGGSLDTHRLLTWFKEQLAPFSHLGFQITDLNESWRDGFGFCALVELYRPQVCSVATFKDVDKQSRVQIGLMLIEQEFGIEPMLSADDICRTGILDKLAMLSYLAQVNEALENEPPKKIPKLQGSNGQARPSLERTSNVIDTVNTPPRSASPSAISGAQARVKDTTSPSAKVLLKHLTSSTVLKSMEQSAVKTQAWQSDRSTNQNTSIDPTSDIMEAVLKSTRTPSKLSRKKVMFKKPPPAVVKYRQSQVDVGEEFMPPAAVSPRNGDGGKGISRRALGQVPSYMLKSNARAACAGLAQQRILALQRGGDDVITEENNKGGARPRQLPQTPPRGRAMDRVQQEDKRRSASPITSNLCCVCKKSLSLIERHNAHGVFFHRNCFRCATCDTPLHVGTSVFQKKQGAVRFYCYSHAYAAGAVDVQFSGQEDQVRRRSDATDLSPRQQKAAAQPPTHVRGQTDELSDSSSEYSSDETEDEEEEEEEEEEEQAEQAYFARHGYAMEDDDVDILTALKTTTLPKNPTKTTLKKALRNQNSVRLLVADEIQRGLDDVECQEEELEEKGKGVESLLRTQAETADDDELMGEWLDVLKRKKELVDKEAKLMLKKKLVELQDRHNRLQLAFKMAGLNDDMPVMVEKLAADTEDLEDEMECLITQMKSISTCITKETTA